MPQPLSNFFCISRAARLCRRRWWGIYVTGRSLHANLNRQVQALQAQAVALRAELATAKNLAEDLQAQLNVAEESIATLQQTVAELEQAVRCGRR